MGLVDNSQSGHIHQLFSMRLLLILLFAFSANAQIGKLRNGNFKPASSGPQTPDTVSVLGRLEDSTHGTAVTSTIANNGFIGDTDGTWSFVSLNGSTYPVVHTTQTIFEDGVQISGGSGLGDSGNTRFYTFANNGDDRYPRYTFTVVKSSVVWGFNLICSNFTSGSGLYANIFQVGISPYQRVSFSDGSELGGTRFGVATHTGGSPGTGTYIDLTNGIPYRIVGKFDGAGDSTELKVYAINGPGSYSLVGTSTCAGDGAGTANEIRLTNEDDHGNSSSGGTWRQDNYMWSYNLADYPDVMLPDY